MKKIILTTTLTMIFFLNFLSDVAAEDTSGKGLSVMMQMELLFLVALFAAIFGALMLRQDDNNVITEPVINQIVQDRGYHSVLRKDLQTIKSIDLAVKVTIALLMMYLILIVMMII